MEQKIISVLVMAVCLVGCKTEIELDYRSVEPLYVIVGTVGGGEATVTITQTSDVTAEIDDSPVADAQVAVLCPNGDVVSLDYDDGTYTATLATEPYGHYELEVTVGSTTFTATSVMQEVATIDTARFIMYDLVFLKYLIMEIEFEDIVGVDNYYFYQLYQNDKLFAWDVFKDTRSADDTFTKHIMLVSEESLDHPDEGGKKVSDGDEFEVVLYTIDEGVYEYLSSLGVISSTSANPITNFTGGCLGYFSCQGRSNYAVQFKREDIEE